MARYSVETKLSPEEAIERARAYFGEGGLGLELIEQEEPCCVYFEGGGGHVLVTACPKDKTEVELETREWDYHAKRFVRELGR